MEPIAVTTEIAACMVALDERAFLEAFVHTGRLRVVRLYDQDLIDVAELRAVWRGYVAEQRSGEHGTSPK